MSIKIVECPRDAMQGLHHFIPTAKKIEYINLLGKIGFDTLDAGSFVSARMIPQMQDTPQVFSGIENKKDLNLLAIIANKKGAERSLEFDHVKYLGFPFSVSETFQQRNTNSSIEESFQRVKEIQNLISSTNKRLVIYISMGFGNPYGDKWSPEIVHHWVEKIAELGIKTISLSDTIGIADSAIISSLFSSIIPHYESIEIGAHLHTRKDNWKEKIQAAYDNGCKRFDGAIKGFGGCPMASDDLTGNMPTEFLIDFFTEKKIDLNLDLESFNKASLMATQIMS